MLALRRLPVLLGAALSLAAIPAGPGGSGATASAAPAGTRTIVLREFSYSPRVVTVRAGEAVRFVNRGKIEHTVADVSARGEIVARLVKPRPLATGDSQVVRFRKPGLVRYVCTFHPTLMGGRIRVVA